MPDLPSLITLDRLAQANGALQELLAGVAGNATSLPALPPLDRALADVDRVFGIAQVLADPSGADVPGYYTLSAPGYRKLLSADGAIHLALSTGGQFTDTDFARQADIIADLIRQTGARRVVELGCGRGFNLIRLARLFPDVAFHGLDLTPSHIAEAQAAATGLANVTLGLGRHEALPTDLGAVDLVFAVETLCHTTDRLATMAGVARHLAPGGLFAMIDAVAVPDASPAQVTARQLYESVTAVGPGFAVLADWQAACRAGGLDDLRWVDLTPAVLPGVRRLYRAGRRYFSDWRVRLGARLLPMRLRRNAIGALIGPYLVEAPDPARTALRYGLLLARHAV